MLNLPSSILDVCKLFAPLFSCPVFNNGLVLLAGHFLYQGNRTITNFLRAVGLSQERRYSRYHDVFRKARWSSFKASKILLYAIEARWICGGRLRLVMDTTLERRRGPKILGLGMHRDASYSTKKRKVFSPGHNWLVVCALIEFPGAGFAWSLPFLSILLQPKEVLSTSQNKAEKGRPKRLEPRSPKGEEGSSWTMEYRGVLPRAASPS